MFFLYVALLLLALFAYAVNKRNLPASFIYLGILLGLTLAMELVKPILKSQIQNIFFIDHLFQPTEFVLFSLVYYDTFYLPLNKCIVKSCMAAFVPLALLASVFVDGWKERNITSFLMEGFLLVLFAAIYIYELLRRPVYNNILKIPFFWINLGVLLYYSGTFFQMGLQGYFININPQLAKELNLINQILNYLLYLCFFIGFLCKTQKS